MKTILLYGALGKKFGRKHVLDVKNPAEAIRALSVIAKGFKQYMIDDKVSGYQIFVGTEDIYLNDMHSPTSDKEFIRIVPIVTGSANNNSLKIIIGVIIIAIASYYSAGAATGSTTAAVWGAIGKFGTLLVLQGISGMIFDPSTDEDNETPESNPSYAFDGPVNTTRQGNPVPVGYGILRGGSQVISAGITTNEY